MLSAMRCRRNSTRWGVFIGCFMCLGGGGYGTVFSISIQNRVVVSVLLEPFFFSLE